MTETAATPPSDHPSTPLFIRARDGRMLAGVCAGIATRWGLDVTLVRIGAVVLTLLSGIGLAAYVAAWLLTPSVDGPAPLAPGSRLATSMSRDGRRWGSRLWRIVAIVVVALLVAGAVHSLWWGVPAAAITVAAVVVLLVGTRLGRWALAAIVAVAALALGTVGAFGASFGARTLHVGSVDDLHPSYDYGTGKVALDLSRIATVSGEHETSVHLGRGDVTVTVPQGVPVLVHARAGLGSVTVDGHRVSGVDAEQTVPIGAGSATATDRLVVDVTVGAGSVKIAAA